MWGAAGTPSPPAQGNPPSPATCLPGCGRCRLGRQRGRPMPARLHCPMAPQDAEGQPAQRASGEALPTGPHQDWLPGPERCSGWVQRAKVPRAQPAWGSPAVLFTPRRLLGLLCAHPLPTRQHCLPVWCLSAPPAREPKHHQASSQARNQVAASTEPTVGQENQMRKVNTCVHGRLPSAEQTPSCYNLTRSEERRVGKECLRLCRSRWSPYH